MLSRAFLPLPTLAAKTLLLRRGLAASQSSSSASISFSSNRAFSTSSAVDEIVHDNIVPKLKTIPALPLLGSHFPFSGIDPVSQALKDGDIIGYMRRMHKENGPFYKVGFPGLGSGIFGTMYVVRSPHEMLKVIKAEGSYPSGLVQQFWPSIGWMKDRNVAAVGLFGKGEEWKRLRSFLQKDLLAPQSAREYMPSIVESTKDAMKRLKKNPDLHKDLGLFLNFCSADMFLYVLFGQGASGDADQSEYDEFVRVTVDVLGKINGLLLSPKEVVAHGVGMVTTMLRQFNEENDHAMALARKRIRTFIDRTNSGSLTEKEKKCYLYKMMERQPDSDVTEQEMTDLCYIMMSAAVDTTAAKTAWNIVQLGIQQDYQTKLREELEKAIEANGQGELTAQVFDKNQVPLLNAFIRETYRCTPPSSASIIKPIQQSVEVYGDTIPAGSTVMFDGLTDMMNPDLVDDPMTFKPERWLKKAVEARKGTPQAIIDHPFYSGPFSQGARRCPGSRVSYLEIQAILARVLLDFNIEGPTDMHWSDVKAALHLLADPVWPEEVKLVPRHG